MINRVLLYNSGGGIGDALQILPLINGLKNEFKNANSDYTKIDIKTNKKHHRSGLSKQYLKELKKETLSIIINKLSSKINQHFNYALYL